MQKTAIQKMALAGLFLALGLILPFLTGQIPTIGQRLLPMHLPVLLGGFVLGGPWALVVGLVTPLLRSFLFGMPPLFPTAAAMSWELAAYGLLTGYFYKRFPPGNTSIVSNLILAMLGGRLVWGLASLALYGLAGNPFTWQLFLAGAFFNALPGIIAQLLLLPPLIIALRRARLV